VPGLGEQKLATLLDDVAAATPAPGGGSSAALAGALGAALVEMAASIAGEQEDASRSRELRGGLLELAERELSSYEPVLEARRLPRDDPARAARLDAALVEASVTPLGVAEAAAEVAELGVSVARASSKDVRGDALAGTLLAEAACAAAATLVEINLERQLAAPALEQVRGTLERAGRARREALGPPRG
jgi:formiminotetrahydrofolate cyclodeaminase